jgi:hypothetical protein
MKLLVAPGCRLRVVFAEAGKDVVDFLFSLMAVPPGTAVRLLGKESVAVCMGQLYSSAEKLADGPYVQPGAARDAVLCAAMPSPAAAGPNSWLFRLPQPPAPAPKRFFNCSTSYGGCCGYVTEVRGTLCPCCGSQMVTEATIVGASPPQPVAERGAGRHGDVHGDGRPPHLAHVQRLQHRAHQRLRRQGPRLATGEDRADWIQRG